MLNKADDEVKELYSLKSEVIMLGSDIDVRPTKKYISFRRRRGFLGIVVLKSKLKAYLNIEISHLRDPLNKVRDVKNIGHHSPGETEVIIAQILGERIAAKIKALITRIQTILAL